MFIGAIGYTYSVGLASIWLMVGWIAGDFLDWYPRDLPLPGLSGGILFAASWLFAGLSVIGQPHIMIRFAALNDAREMRRARLYYYLWFTVFYAMAIGVGLLARILLDNPAQFDAELALPSMALELLPPPLVGLVLAGIFAATISTADSLILSCSAALSNDDHRSADQRRLALGRLSRCSIRRNAGHLDRFGSVPAGQTQG